ncbi:MAG: carboxyl transferase domain-containing protein [Candidatus Korobacteraceae bacterium]
MKHEFQRIAIVNRGEAAMRFIQAAREFNLENNASLRTIALFTDPDRHANFVREADEAVSLGAAQVIDPNTRSLKSRYLDYDVLARALTAARAEAVWVGWGFVAEHAQFADLCRDMGIVFIGPEGDVMRRLGDKISSRLLAEQAQIPVATWSGRPVETVADAVNHGARRVEVQIIADNYGTTWAAGVRDCTIQLGRQNVIAEAPSPALSLEQDQALREAAVRLSRAAGYHNAGTVQFLYEPDSQRFLFTGMNTRLDAEHSLTECTTGIDLVKLQIHVARGGRLEGEPPRTTGHAIEVQLTAEDADNEFASSSGAIERLRIPTGPGVRVDVGVEEGDFVPAEFDPTIAKIIAWGQNRREALARLRRVLHESVVVIKGGASNRAFLLELLNRAEVQNAQGDIGWLDGLAAKGQHLSRQFVEVALVQAAIEAYESERKVEQAQFYASALRGRPQVRNDVGHTTVLRYGDQSYSINVYRLGLQQYRVEVDGSRIEAHLERLGPFEYWLTAFGRRFHIISVEQGIGYRIELDGVSHRIDRDDGGVVRAPSPAVVASVLVKPGDVVSTGDRLAVLEAMKMEMQVVATFPGRVKQVLAIPHVQVGPGDPLLQIEPATDRQSTTSTERASFGISFGPTGEAENDHSRWLRNLEELRQLMLGFDVDRGRTARLLAEWNQFPETVSDGAEMRDREDEILNIFVDLCSLFRRNPKFNGQTGAESPSTEAYLFSYLRMLDTRGDGAPPEFVAAVGRAVAHYGVTTLDRSPELEESLLWIYKSHQRLEQQAAPIMGVLQRRLARLAARPLPADESFRTLLDRMISITRGLFPAVSDLARELRYRSFEQPSFEKARKEIYAEAQTHLDYLAANPDAPDRSQRLRALIDCPQPLVSLLSGRFAGSSRFMQELMLEAMISRYYCVRALTDFRTVSSNGFSCVSAQYVENGTRFHIFATHVAYQQFASAVQALFPFLAEVPANDEVVLDFYTWQEGPLAASQTAQQEIHSILNVAGFPRPIRHVVVVSSGAGSDLGMAAMQHFTYEPSDDGYQEVELFRGVHPMMAERLHLWRLKNFKIERQPSVEDVYLLRAVAIENPKDERLFAVAEVRDLTPVYDKAGRIIQLPHLERMFAETTAAIRSFQAKRTPRTRLHWNRIFLYVWPTLNLKPDEVSDIVHKLAPLADGLGLEQVVVRVRVPNSKNGELRDTVMRISAPGDAGLLMTFRPAATLQPMKPLTAYDQKVVKMRQRGLLYPYEIVKMLTPKPDDTRADFSPGEFVEYDLDAEARLQPVDRPYGQNKANIIVGLIRNFTDRYTEGTTRVMLLGDPSKDLGAIAEPECRRVLAALDLAEEKHIPLEWFTLSAGAKISMDSGVENMEWIAQVLRRLITFTQAGGEINLVVNGINVGAQPYWNAEATMLMHTRGVLIMTPTGAMVLTGKRALDYSGSVSAEDNFGIGGYDRIMGFNGQAQYFARDINDACQILMRHYEHTYIAPGERFPRRAISSDPIERDVRLQPHAGEEGSFKLIGEIFSDETNPGRKKSFDIRQVMKAVVDQDHVHLERWSGMRSAHTTVVWDAHLGGYPVCLIGIESKPIPRLGFVPADGPDQWTAGTLFPLSSKKVARAINSASNNRPVVVLANLSGFDGSPESMRCLQLEYGAEIGRSVVNFKGPMVFCVISRYHGGAYVVFSRALNEQLEVIALEGSYASVIGGAPAAAVVFTSEVEARTRKDPRVLSMNEAMAQADGAAKNRLRAESDELFKIVYSEKLGEVAAEFDGIHSVHRALEVGALNNIISPKNLRPYLIQSVENGIVREEQKRSARIESEKLDTADVHAVLQEL